MRLLYCLAGFVSTDIWQVWRKHAAGTLQEQYFLWYWFRIEAFLNDFRDKIQDEFEIVPHPRNAQQVRERVRAEAKRAGMGDEALADLEIAVGEAVTNAILYGSPEASSRIRISSGLNSGAFWVEIHDQGHGFDPAQVSDEEDPDSLGGRGIHLMRALVDTVDLHHRSGGMVARLSKTLT